MVVNETDIASLQSDVNGNPVPQITWLKENTSVAADKRIVQSGGGIMIKSHFVRKSSIARHSSKNRIFYYFAKTSLLVT